MSSATRLAIVFLFVVLCCAVFAGHYLVTGRTIFLLTSVGASPLLFIKLNFEQFRNLEFWPVMWTTAYGAGGPTAAGISSFNPVILLVSWLKTFEASMVGYEIVMRAAGAFGMFALLRSYTLGFVSSLFGTGLFVFNVYASSAGSDPQLGLAVLLLPWIVLCLQATIARQSVAGVFGLSLATGLFYLVSTTQIFSFTIFICVIPLTLILLFQHWRSGAGNRLKAVLVSLALLCVSAIACLALTAFDLVAQVNNTVAGLDTFSVSTASRDYYVAAPVAALLGFGLFVGAISRRPLRLLAVIAIAAGYLASYRFAGLSLWSIVTSNFTSVSIADYVFEVQKPRYFLTIFSALGGCAGLLSLLRQRTNPALVALVCVGAAYGLATFIIVPSSYYIRFFFVPIMGAIALTALGGADLLERMERAIRPQWRTVAAAAFVLFATAESANMNFRQTLYTDSIKYTGLSSPEMQFLNRLPPNARVIDTYENEHTRWLRALPLERGALLRWIIPAYAGVQTFSRVGVSFVPDGFQAFYDRALRKTYFGIQPGDWPPLLNLAAVTHLLSRDPPDSRLTVELRGPDYLISRNPNAMPRVQLYHRADIAPNDDGLDRLEASLSAGTPLAIVAPEDAAALKPLDPNAAGTASIAQYGDDKVAITANVSGRSLLVLADTYHPGWKALIDGSPAAVLRANVAFRGVLLEAGEHRIEFRFEPPFRKPLVVLASLALALHILILAGALAWNLRRR